MIKALWCYLKCKKVDVSLTAKVEAFVCNSLLYKMQYI